MTGRISDTAVVLAIFCVLLIPLAAAGIALINAGLGRAHGASHALLSSLSVFSVASLVYIIVGFAWQGVLGGAAHHLFVSGKDWDLLARQSLILGSVPAGNSLVSLLACFQMFCVGIAALIPLGAALERWRLPASCASAALLAGLIYPLFAHWVWSGGWLAQLGINSALGHGFVDVGGAGPIQAVGGLTALAIAWILGPRTGKYTSGEMPSAIPGHSTVLVFTGCFLALAGWLGLNAAGALLLYGVPPERAPLIAINTVLGAGSAFLAAVLITGVRFGRTDASISANGWVGGLVAGSAACAFVVPAEAIIIGLIAGTLVTYSVEWFELRFAVDDPAGAISVHAVGGIWGLLAVGLLARFQGPLLNVVMPDAGLAAALNPAFPPQLLAQLVGIATLLGFILPLAYTLNLLLNRFLPFRVHVEGERQGLDLFELGGGAYPEFVTHSEDLTQLRRRKT